MMPRAHKPRQSREFGLAWADAPVPCCFCPDQINKGDMIWHGWVEGVGRRAHTDCAHHVLVDVIKVRDAKGKSEDKRDHAATRSDRA
jgi:hypothetical protein